MSIHEDLELLNAVLALAVIDGDLSGGEKGIIQGLAARAGIGQVSLDAMIERARREPNVYEDLRISDARKARKAMALLVAQARVDGEISDAERELLVKFATLMDIDTDEFAQIYADGVARADEARRRRSDPTGT